MTTHFTFCSRGGFSRSSLIQRSIVTLPEHAICSALLAQFGMRQRFGAKGVLLLAIAGTAPDLDAVVKLVGDSEFWRLHHALGHGLVSVVFIAAALAVAGRVLLGLRPVLFVFCWCFGAACLHSLTDSLYWWGVQWLWPFGDRDFCFGILEYLDLLVLALWLTGAFCLYRFPARGVRVATLTLAVFAGYVGIRGVLPPPNGVLGLVTGKWMYIAPHGTPVLDWW